MEILKDFVKSMILQLKNIRDNGGSLQELIDKLEDMLN